MKMRRVAESVERSNKELKLTKPCTIGASQLNSSVGRTAGRATKAGVTKETTGGCSPRR